MADSRDYLELSSAAIECFSNDGRIDAAELQSLLEIAERDEVVDDNEKRVLRNVISRIKPDEIDGEMKSVLSKVLDQLD